MIVQERDDHFSLFSKPKYTDTTTSLGSQDTRMYKKYVPVPRDINFVEQYFVFEEMKRRGFTSKYLTVNPYENDFYEYVSQCEQRDKDLPASIAHNRLIAELEVFHKKALASLK